MSNHNKETEARCIHCYRHYVEGTAAWALYMMRIGHKVTNPMYDQRVYHLPEGGMIHVNGIKSIAGSEWIDYWCIDIPDGWEIYEEPKPELKPLLADAKPGWLAKLPDGTWFQLLSRYSDPRCNNEISFGVPYFSHISYDIDGKPRHFGGQNIIHVEPLAEVGSIDRASQDMRLGKRVKLQQTMFEMRGGKVWKWKIGHSGALIGQYPVQSLDEWYRFYGGYRDIGWQLYEEPAPLKAGDWVNVKCAPTYGCLMIEEVTQSNGVTMYHCRSFKNGLTAWTHNELRKLDPYGVIVRIGCLEGTVRCYDKFAFWLIGKDGERSVISFAMLDPETAALVRELLKAQGGAE